MLTGGPGHPAISFLEFVVVALTLFAVSPLYVVIVSFVLLV